MASEPEPGAFPAVLPPEEETAAADLGINFDMAAREQAQFDRELSGHTVQAAALRNDLARAYIKNMDADRNMRTTYAGRILRYLEFYSGGVGVLLVISWAGKPWGLQLEPGILATLVGSTAVAAIGLVGFIARGLFRPPPGPPTEPFGAEKSK